MEHINAKSDGGLALKKVFWFFLFLYFLFVVLVRFWNINLNDFVFYDEGMWAATGREFVALIDHNPPKNLTELAKILGLMTQSALSTAKSLWAFLSMLRGLFVGVDGFYFTRIISAIFGLATLVLTFFFAERCVKDRRVAVVSVIVLALLPSHVFYSRLALQESLSTFFFTLGLFIYLFANKNSWRALGSSICFVIVFLSNYRMIVLPVFLLAFEGILFLLEKEKLNWQRWLLTVVIFLCGIFFVGSLDGGRNMHITSAWLFHQGQLAGTEDKSLLNFLSYPYFLFSLESWIFGALFFSAFYFLFKKEFKKVQIFLLILCVMGVFSFGQEKGARYLCCVLPLSAIVFTYQFFYWHDTLLWKWSKTFLIVLLCIMTLDHANKSLLLALYPSAYRKSAQAILKINPQVKILSTQNQVQQLYLANNKNALEPPLDMRELVSLYRLGYSYLVLDPQAYISMTQDKRRFSSKLRGYLELIRSQLTPVAKYEHFYPYLFKRFVLEHNINLARSIRFIRDSQKEKYNELYVYELKNCLEFMKNFEIKNKGLL